MERIMAVATEKELEAYIYNTFSQEQQVLINESLAIFITFSYSDVFEKLDAVLAMSETEESALTQNAFFEHIRLALISLCEMHKVHVDTQVSIRLLNQLMTGLYRVVHVEDPEPYSKVVESPLTTNEEKLARILSMLTSTSEETYLENIDSVGDRLIENILTTLAKKEEAQEEEVDEELQAMQDRLLKRLRDFFNVLGTDNTAYKVIETGVLVGHPFALYIPIVSDLLLDEDLEKFSLNMLSVFLMSIDGFEDPYKAYLEHSETLVENTTHIPRLEAIMLQQTQALKSYEESLKISDAVKV